MWPMLPGSRAQSETCTRAMAGRPRPQEAGVALQDIADHAQHADINTTRKHYIVPSVETSRRVARQRVAHRLAKGDKR
jgi:hypothetical protein